MLKNKIKSHFLMKSQNLETILASVLDKVTVAQVSFKNDQIIFEYC